jgi:hypothetical protein
VDLDGKRIDKVLAMPRRREDDREPGNRARAAA